jgi:hypothetical protein
MCGKKANEAFLPDDLWLVLTGLLAWIKGQTLCEIEKLLGGTPDDDAPTKRVCPRARVLVGTIIPRGISFIVGLVSHVVKDVNPFGQQEDLDQRLVECLSSAVRRGFDTVDKLAFASKIPSILSRVQIHQTWAMEHPT